MLKTVEAWINNTHCLRTQCHTWPVDTVTRKESVVYARESKRDDAGGLHSWRKVKAARYLYDDLNADSRSRQTFDLFFRCTPQRLPLHVVRRKGFPSLFLESPWLSRPKNRLLFEGRMPNGHAQINIWPQNDEKTPSGRCLREKMSGMWWKFPSALIMERVHCIECWLIKREKCAHPAK